jgi:uncharacterized membrane-anchored protein
LASISVLRGPAIANVKNLATLQVPAGYWFTDAAGAKLLLQRMGNPGSGREMGFLAPTSAAWCVVLEFADIGYVKSTDAADLNPAAILAAIRAGNATANRQREEKGLSAVDVLGWDKEPVYDPETRTLEWAVRAATKGGTVINHSLRLLGRSGVIEVTLLDQQNLSSTFTEFKRVVRGLSFKPGEQYEDHRGDDRVAKGGMVSLLASGETDGASKVGGVGLFSWQGKVWWLGWVFCAVAVMLILATKFRPRMKPRSRSHLPCAVFHVTANGSPILSDKHNEPANAPASSEMRTVRLKKKQFRFDMYYFNLIRKLL